MRIPADLVRVNIPRRQFSRRRGVKILFTLDGYCGDREEARREARLLRDRGWLVRVTREAGDVWVLWKAKKGATQIG